MSYRELAKIAEEEVFELFCSSSEQKLKLRGEIEMHSAGVKEIDKNLKEHLIESLEFINWKKQIKRDSTVFIKPNFTFPYYKEGITTNPELLKNLLEIIKDRADNVILSRIKSRGKG